MGPRHARLTCSGYCLPVRNKRKAKGILQVISQKPLKQQSLLESFLHETVCFQCLWNNRIVPYHHERNQGPPTPRLRKLIPAQVLLISKGKNPRVNWINVQEEQVNQINPCVVGQERINQGSIKSINPFHRIHWKRRVLVRDGWDQKGTYQPRINHLRQFGYDGLFSDPTIHGQRPIKFQIHAPCHQSYSVLIYFMGKICFVC